MAGLGAKVRDTYTGSAWLASHEADGDTWLTPRHILASLGQFDLDPCAAESNPEWAAPQFYTRHEDGLRQPWHGRVWCNPPFSDTRDWILLSARHVSGILLLPVSVESRIWRETVWPSAKAILLLHGRTRFCRPDGSVTTGRPRRSIALIAWSDFDAGVLERAPFAGVLLKSWHQR